MEKISIVGGRLIDPKNALDAPLDLHLAAGKVAALSAPGDIPDGFAAARRIDAAGSVVCPGLIDLSARLPGLESELAAAAAGGVTTIVCPPDVKPILDEPGLVERLVHRAGDFGGARLLPLGALTVGLRGEALAELGGLRRAGCIAFSQGNAAPIADTSVLLRAMQYAATFGHALHLQPQDAWLGNGVAHDGEIAARLGLPVVPVAAESIAIATALELMRASGARVHFTRLSSAAGVALCQAARDEGLPVSCDVGVHHLHLTENDIGYFDSAARFNPPLRSALDRSALRAAANSGLAAICSDHAPISADGKQLPFAEAEAGATGLELLLPLTLQWASEEKQPLSAAIARLTSQPAAILGIIAGELTPGAAADVCVFNPATTWQIGPRSLHSKGHSTPFSGQEVSGRVSVCLVGGRIVHGGMAAGGA